MDEREIDLIKDENFEEDKSGDELGTSEIIEGGIGAYEGISEENSHTQKLNMKEQSSWLYSFWTKLFAFLLSSAAITSLVVFICAVAFPYLNIDSRTEIKNTIPDVYDLLNGLKEIAAPLMCISFVLVVLFLVYFSKVSGRSAHDSDIRTSWQEKIPFDLYLVSAAGMGALAFAAMISLCEEMVYGPGHTVLVQNNVYILLLLTYIIALIITGMWMSLAVRVKDGTVFRYTVCWIVLSKIIKWTKRIFKAIGEVLSNVSFIWKTVTASVIVGTLILIEIQNFNHRLASTLVILSVVFLWYLAMQLSKLKLAGEALSKGNLDYKVDTKRMHMDFREHGENLNSIREGMSKAVNEQLKSERMKTELITNVSHDIKTPLTSIVNYVDLLQKEHTPEQEKEYLEVLARQSKKMKKLTEDLVEMSKASSGSIPCNMMKTNAAEMIKQVTGEYEEKFREKNIELVTETEEELYCMADGNLLWRVMDNLLGNAYKYSMEGTRVYVKCYSKNDRVLFDFSNISRDALNISADELMERFVRGDSSRNSEGSGLGLNIAKSLAELQNGSLFLKVDGDLFKARIVMMKTE